uniref:Uncharacterized protein n=1 Tax=Anopheles epiroticus TaxID=199890 RepID=A0A182PWV4_9DIPT
MIKINITTVKDFTICDYEQMIKYVNARFSGANHDAHVCSVSGIDNLFKAKYDSGLKAFKLVILHMQENHS